jgi:penicillin amidase
MRRILRYLNYAIAAALVLTCVAIYWYAWRPLPAVSGSIKAPVDARATASRDEFGVPHVEASSLWDALFVQGYVTAQDRMFQMDLLRRLAAGELAEVLGSSALPADRESRRLRVRPAAEACAAALPPQDRAILEAYARGVNSFLRTHRNRLPLEFTLLNYAPHYWSVADSLLVMLQMANTLDRSWRADLVKEAMLKSSDPAMGALLYAAHPVTAGGASNAWALSGAHTASRKPILAGDPHLEFSLPSPWYMVQLKAPGLNVLGVSLPGVPGIIAGHNDRIAWSITSLPFDVQDVYLERFDASTGRYVFDNRVEQARAERSLIRVRGSAAEDANMWITRHGPILAADGERYISMRWAAADAAGYQFPVLDFNRARNWDEFRTALARFPGPGLTFVYADVDGNIGSQTAGRFPVRKGFDGAVPLDGASGRFEWDGYIPFGELPSVYNPPSGIIISANENPFLENYARTVSGNFAAPYRHNQIARRLESKQGWRAEEMLSIQTDVYSALARLLAQELAAAHNRQAARWAGLQQSVDMLRQWDGQMRTGHPEPMLIALVYQHVRTALAERASPGQGLAYGQRISPAVVEHLIREKSKIWFPDYDRFLLEALSGALAEGRRMQGEDIRGWDYGKLNSVRLDNPVVGRLPFVGRYFNLGVVQMSGSPETVNQIARLGSSIVGPSMRMVVDLGNLDASLMNITLGQSGQIFSPHYKDQWKTYLAGRSLPARFAGVQAVNVLVFSPEQK